jgi:hypothetical protein
MGIGLSSMEKKEVIVAATASLLKTRHQLFRLDGDDSSLFRYAGHIVTTDAPLGLRAYIDHALIDFTQGIQRMPLFEKKKRAVLERFERVLHALYAAYVPQHGDGIVQHDEWDNIVAVYHALDSATIDLDVFRKELLDTLLWELL